MNTKKTSTENCQAVEQYLVSNDHDVYPQEVQNHLNSCTACRQYAANLERLRETYSLPEHDSGLSPDLSIKQNLLHKVRQRNRNNRSVYEKAARLFTYRIPLYQAAGAIAIILMLFFAADNISDISYDYANISSGELIEADESFSSVYFPDSLNVTGIKNIGRSALEDSAITKYMVTTL
jgi:hypothetical protein